MYDDLFRYIPLAALVISIFALCVSSANVGWNVYKEIALRGRVKVSFGSRDIYHETFPKPLHRVMVSAINFGPGVVPLKMVIWKKAALWRHVTRKVEKGVMLYDHQDMLSGRLPARLDVGDGIDIILGSTEGFEFPKGTTHVGVNDSFGRSHWAPRRDIREFRACLKSIKKANKTNP